MMLRYRLADIDPAAREFALELTIPQPCPDGQVLAMAAWTPGSYMLRDHARHVTWIEAVDTRGQFVALEWLDKQTWRTAPCDGALTVRWRVHAHELSVRTAHLDSLWGFADAAALWLRPLGLERLPCQLELCRSSRAWAEDWQVAVMLAPQEVDAQGYGVYQADDVEALLDAPLALGKLRELRFSVRGIEHRFVWLGRVDFAQEQLALDLARACEAVAALFGDTPLPFARYVFLALVTADGYGGLEHREGTALLCKPAHFPREAAAERSPTYREFLGLCAHEYLHAWLVKRIRPQAFMPRANGSLPLEHEAYTRLLWLFEGVTSYYDDLVLLRAGLITLPEYLHTLAATMSRVQRTPGRERLTLEQASLTAWTRLYKADENTPNVSVSYYTKGALFAWVLDIALRCRSVGRVSLDDVLPALWRDFAQCGRGVAEHGVDAWLIAVTGVDVQDVLDAGLRSCAELPLEMTAHALGLNLHWAAAQNEPWLGVELKSDVQANGLANGLGRAVVSTVYRGMAGEQAGLAPQDVLLALDGLRLSRDDLLAQLHTYRVGDEVELHVFRRDELMRVSLVLQAAPKTQAHLQLNAARDMESSTRLRLWSGLSADSLAAIAASSMAQS